MNILFLLTPKKNVLFLTIDMTVGKALSLLKDIRYSSVPVLDRDGYYVGSITEGDLLWHIENSDNVIDPKSEKLKKIVRYRDYKVASINIDVEKLFDVAISQNYIPIVDDRNFFIGIVTRRAILSHYQKLLQELRGIKYNENNPALKNLLRRRSIRKFKDEKIDMEIIKEIMKAGLAAPSARNRRPIHILLNDIKDTTQMLYENSAAFKLVHDAPYSFYIFGDTESEDSDFFLNNDASAVTMNLLNAISSYNLGGVWLGVARTKENQDLVYKAFKVPARYKLFSVVAFGVADETKDPHDELDDELVHINRW